jgi:hypothetical protein
MDLTIIELHCNEFILVNQIIINLPPTAMVHHRIFFLLLFNPNIVTKTSKAFKKEKEYIFKPRNNSKNIYIFFKKEYNTIKLENFTQARRKEPVLFGEELVLVDLAATAFGSIARSFFPLVRHYHLR